MSDNLPRFGDLMVEEDMAFQRRSWMVERIAWLVWAALILAALLGLLGAGGPLSSAEKGKEGDPLHLKYERFLRRHGPAKLELSAMPVTAGSLDIAFDEGYLAAFKIESILPEPAASLTADGQTTLTFSAPTAGVPVHISLRLSPDALGTLKTRVSTSQGGSQSIKHFVYH